MPKRKIFFLLFASIIVLAAIVAFTTFEVSERVTMDMNHSPQMRGVCWVGGDSIASHNFDPLLDINGNWISQTPFGWMDQHDEPKVHMNTEQAWWGEADRGIIHTTQLAHQKGIKVMLKPHIWLMNSNGKWRHDIGMNSSEEWDQWFESYANFIMHYAKLAATYNIESLCIGTELYTTTSQHPDKWRAIITEIKKVYSGQLTYAANWYKEYEEITFWGDLDYIGLQSYFPLTMNSNPSVSELNKGWKKHKKSIRNVAERFNKKVILTEVGFKNSADAAIEPWTWPQKLDASKVTRSDETQANCYQAMFESLWHEPWVDGFFIWKWFHTTHRYIDSEAYWKERQERRAAYYQKKSGSPTIYFSPQQTEALEVLHEWYHK